MISSIAESELILNPEGNIYHLNLAPGDLAETIITVGDPERVPLVSQYFDEIELKRHNREIVTHTGYLNKQRISVISTGMGTGCIDIVLNEIDALFNIDFAARKIKTDLTAVKLIRIGTCGSLQAQIAVDSFVVSEYAFGLDNLLYYYNQNYSRDELKLLAAFKQHLEPYASVIAPYASTGTPALVEKFKRDCFAGITATCTGFYASQGRNLRASPANIPLFSLLQTFQYEGLYVANFEMETSAIYGLANLMGHQSCSISAVMANRATQEFSRDPYTAIDKLICLVLAKISEDI